MSEREFRARIVGYILDGSPERAIKLLAEYYGVSEPDLRVGTVKRSRKVLGCYVQKEKRIYIATSQLLTNPFVILHEFYHHLRATATPKNRQVEKRADQFALNFIRDFSSGTKST